MNFFLENYAQLVAIAVPVLTLAGMNVLLALGGERGTLLLPSAGPLQIVARGVNRVPARATGATAQSAANEPDYRYAA